MCTAASQRGHRPHGFDRPVMRRPTVRAAIGAVAALVIAAGVTVAVASTRVGSSLVDIGAGLRGARGLHAAIYSRGPAHTAVMTTDAQGRVWIGTASYDDAGTDGVSVVATAGAAATQVVRGLHTVLGLLWRDDSLFVASKERVDAYTGFDGQRFAQQREVLALPAGIGEVNGLAVAPNGRLLLAISAPCDHCAPTNPMSGAIVSFLPDGSDLRTYATGIRAPIALTFVPGTTTLLVTMNQRDDLGDRTPGDWLATVEQGSSWGFPACYGQRDGVCTGTPSTVTALDKHAAATGVAVVSRGVVVAEWAAGKVLVVSRGKTGPSVFVTGIARPMAVAAVAQGAQVLIADWETGNIYRIRDIARHSR